MGIAAVFFGMVGNRIGKDALFLKYPGVFCKKAEQQTGKEEVEAVAVSLQQVLIILYKNIIKFTEFVGGIAVGLVVVGRSVDFGSG